MTGRRLIFHPKVEEDLDGIIAHYVALDPALPGRFRTRLVGQLERIEQFPISGAFLFETYRRAVSGAPRSHQSGGGPDRSRARWHGRRVS